MSGDNMTFVLGGSDDGNKKTAASNNNNNNNRHGGITVIPADTSDSANHTTGAAAAAGDGSKTANPNGNMNGDSNTVETELAPIEELIPLCVLHAADNAAAAAAIAQNNNNNSNNSNSAGPLTSTATYGYNIAAMQHRPWRDPGANSADYFNYGFDELSWRVYCQLQAGKYPSHPQHQQQQGNNTSNANKGGGATAGSGETSLKAKAEELLRSLESSAGYRLGMGGYDGFYGNHNMHHHHHHHHQMNTGAAGGYGDGMYGGGSEGGGRYPYQMHHQHHHNHNNMQGDGGGDRDRRNAYRQNNNNNNNNMNNPLRKTKLCQRFAEGRCTNGDNCNYAHGAADLRKPPPAQIQMQMQMQMQMQQQQQMMMMMAAGGAGAGGGGAVPPPGAAGMIPFVDANNANATGAGPSFMAPPGSGGSNTSGGGAAPPDMYNRGHHPYQGMLPHPQHQSFPEGAESGYGNSGPSYKRQRQEQQPPY